MHPHRARCGRNNAQYKLGRHSTDANVSMLILYVPLNRTLNPPER
jgi:hypothetical protein